MVSLSLFGSLWMTMSRISGIVSNNYSPINLSHRSSLQRVTGIGGIFFKANNVKQQREWYKNHLGIEYADKDGGASFYWREDEHPEKRGFTVWSIFPSDTKYFDSSTAPFMMNFRVANLDALVKQLESEGVKIVGGIEEYEYGRFAWVMDPEGNRVELWEPPKQ